MSNTNDRDYVPNHPGGNGKENGKGVGNMPGMAKSGKSNRIAMKAHENLDFDKKEGEVQRVVGD